MRRRTLGRQNLWGLLKPATLLMPATLLHIAVSAVVNSLNGDTVSPGKSDPHSRASPTLLSHSDALIPGFSPVFGESGVFGFVMMMNYV